MPTNFIFWMLLILVIKKYGDCQSVTEFCTNSVQNISYKVGSSINITSPDYPSSAYSISHDCEINIDTGSTERVGFRIVQRNLGDESSKCQIDYFIIDSSGGIIPSKQISCLDNDNNIIIYGHHLSSQSGLKFRLPAGSKQGFILTFTALPLYSMTSSTSTVSAVTSPSGYIMSHNTFNIQYAKYYGDNLRNKLNLTDIRGVTGIHVEFIFMAIGPSTECGSSGDLFELYEFVDDTYNQLYYCYDTRLPPPHQNFSINPSATFIIFEFKSDSLNRYPGFLLKYKVDRSLPSTETTAKNTILTSTTIAVLIAPTTSDSITTLTSTASTSATGYNAETTSTNFSEATSQGGPKINTNVIIGINVAAICCIVIINIAVCLLWRRRSMTRHGTEGQTLDTNTSTSDKQYEQLHSVNNEEGDNHRYSIVKLKGNLASFTTTQEDVGVDKSGSNYMNTAEQGMNACQSGQHNKVYENMEEADPVDGGSNYVGMTTPGTEPAHVYSSLRDALQN